MANLEHLKILEQGVEVWNRWVKENRNILTDLSSADLRGLKLDEVNFFGTKLNNTNLSGTSIKDGRFISAQLMQTNFSYANLSRAEFFLSDFYEADLTEARLIGTNFTLTDFNRVNMLGVEMGFSIFIGCNLSAMQNLETCIHNEWSTIDHSTLAQSPNLPLSFLRGCGLPDEMIDLIPVLQNNPIIFYSCFISYSSKDEEFANRLYADLQDKGIRCWYAPEKMKGGRKIYDQVNEAIRMHDKLLLVLSEDSMKSDWVATEIKKARAREKREGKQMLFPIIIVPYDYIKEWELFDADTGSDLAAEERSYHIPDFSESKDYDSYRKGLERVVRDLKGSPT